MGDDYGRMGSTLEGYISYIIIYANEKTMSFLLAHDWASSSAGRNWITSKYRQSRVVVQVINLVRKFIYNIRWYTSMRQCMKSQLPKRTTDF